jgi:hypothetical protein
MRDKNTGGAGYVWVWSAKHNEPPFYMPFFTHEFGTRREAIIDCEKWALKMLVERAINQQPKESRHWHSPRRDALCAVTKSHLFTQEELDAIEKKLVTFQ